MQQILNLYRHKVYIDMFHPFVHSFNLVVHSSGTKSYRTQDMARDPLFTFVDPSVLARPTFKSFIALLDNYETSTGTI